MGDFEIEASAISIEPTFTSRHVRLSFSADVEDVASLLTAEQIVASVDVDDLLEQIGEDRVIAYFGIERAEQP